jgi:phosphohistidine phosphatase SixA
MHTGRRALWVVAALAGGLAAASAGAGPLAGGQLVEALHSGGYVLVMRHASSPAVPPAPHEADPRNVHGERQLDAGGQQGAEQMGAALAQLQVPFGMVLASPAFRALETARLAAQREAAPVQQLAETGPNVPRAPGESDHAQWLRRQAAVTPQAGTNTLIVTHLPNILGAFGARAAGIAEGETLVFRPDGAGNVALAARVRIEEWPRLAAAAAARAEPR